MDIEAAIKRLVELQKDIPAPSGEKKLAAAYEELPAQPMVFPCFLTLEEGIPEIGRAAGVRRYKWQIGMHLLFATSDQKYSLRSRRRWVQAVLDKFDAQLLLGQRVEDVQYTPITSVTFDPYPLNEQEYTAASFWLQVQTAAAHEFGAGT